MRIAVTGSTSMIGVALIKECLKNNCDVIAFVRKNSKNINRLPTSNRLKIIECSLHEIEDSEATVLKCDIFYHLAWDCTTREGREDVCGQQRNIEYTLNAVKVAKAMSASKFVCAGSQSELGIVHGIITEESRFNPQFPYAMAKTSAYWLSKMLCEQYGIRHIWARVFSVYGIYDHEGTMIDYAIKQFQKGEVAVFSSGLQMWNYLYEDDAGRMFYLLGKMVQESGIYNIANYQSNVLRVYIKLIKEAFGDDAQYVFENHNIKAYGIEPDMTKTRNVIGDIKQISFEEGIRKIIANMNNI